jgi:hypothetical protein
MEGHGNKRNTKNIYVYAGFEVLREVVMKSTFRDIKPCSPFKVN